jgi:stage V sporulation protein S
MAYTGAVPDPARNKVKMYILSEPPQPIPNADLPSAPILKVSSTSRPNKVAGAIAGLIRDYQHAQVQAIGAEAINQAVKAIATAVLYLAEENTAIVFVPFFLKFEFDGEERSVIQFVIDLRP